MEEDFFAGRVRLAVGRELQTRIATRLDAGGHYPRWVLLATLTGLFATTFPITVLTLALPTMAEDFGVDEASLSWVITLPILCSALALPALGKLGDLYGHRRIFLWGFALACVATALAATATNPLQLIFWRTLGQVLGGSTMPSSLALINSVHQGERRARAMGWWSMISAGAPVVGLISGGPAIDLLGWQTIFVLQAGFMVVPVVASWLILRETDRQEAVPFDVLGTVALTLAIGPLLLAVTQARDWGVTSPPIMACGLVGAFGIVLFWWAERRAVAPLLPPELVGSRDALSVIGGSFFTGASYMGGFFLASLMMEEQFGYSAAAAVPVLAVRPLLFATLSPVGGRVAGRSGARLGAVAGCVSLVIGLVGLAVGSAATSVAVVVVCGFVLQGIGYGLLRPAFTTALANTVQNRDLGIAGAAERLSGQVGVAFGIAVLASVYGGDVDRLAPGFMVGAVFGVAGILAALAMTRGVVAPAAEGEPVKAAACAK